MRRGQPSAGRAQHTPLTSCCFRSSRSCPGNRTCPRTHTCQGVRGGTRVGEAGSDALGQQRARKNSNSSTACTARKATALAQLLLTCPCTFRTPPPPLGSTCSRRRRCSRPGGTCEGERARPHRAERGSMQRAQERPAPPPPTRSAASAQPIPASQACAHSLASVLAHGARHDDGWGAVRPAKERCKDNVRRRAVGGGRDDDNPRLRGTRLRDIPAGGPPHIAPARGGSQAGPQRAGRRQGREVVV